MRGRKISSANFVWPVHFARASTLRKGLPTTLRGLPLFPFCSINQYIATKRHKKHKWTSIRKDTSEQTSTRLLFRFLCLLCLFLAALSSTHTNSRAAIPPLRHACAPPLIPPLRKS